MALNDTTAVADALSQRFQSKMAVQWNRTCVLGSKLKGTPGQGKNVAWDTSMDGATASTHAEGADLVAGDFQSDERLAAILPWARYHSAFNVSDSLINQARTSLGSASQLIALFDAEVMSSMTKLAEKVNEDLWVGDGTDGSNASIVGFLGGALEGAGSTYAGIARNSYPLWAGNIDATGGVSRPLTHDLMAKMENTINSASGMSPNLIVCDDAVWVKYQGLFTSGIRADALGTPHLDAGSTVLYFQGVPVVRDRQAPLGTMLFLNTNEAEIQFLPFSADSTRDVPAMQQEGFGSNGDNRMGLGVPFQIKPLARLGHSQKFVINTELQLCVKRPAAFGYISDISVA